MSTTRPAPPHRLATTVTTLVVPALVLVATVAAIVAWAPRLPDPVAVHWDAAQQPDGFGSLKDAAAVPLLIVPLFAAVMWALGFWAGRDTAVRRLAAGLATGLAVQVSGILLGSLADQLDLADAADAPGVGSTAWVATTAAVAAGLGIALLVPRTAGVAAHAPIDPSAPRTDLAPTERAAWTRTVTSRTLMGAGSIAVVVYLVLAVVQHDSSQLLVAGLLIVVLGSFAVLRVTVDARGLVARAPLGWPSVRVPIDEVVAARVTQVAPLREFGGWGYRVSLDGRVGFVLRKGEGIAVERPGGRMTVVTVDDAATGAALLNTLADRARGTTARR